MRLPHAGVKESPYTEDDTKEAMVNLYRQAQETANRDQPAEVRILKHLLSVDDPKQRRSDMESAFEEARRRLRAWSCSVPQCQRYSAAQYALDVLVRVVLPPSGVPGHLAMYVRQWAGGIRRRLASYCMLAVRQAFAQNLWQSALLARCMHAPGVRSVLMELRNAGPSA